MAKVFQTQCSLQKEHVVVYGSAFKNNGESLQQQDIDQMQQKP